MPEREPRGRGAHRLGCAALAAALTAGAGDARAQHPPRQQQQQQQQRRAGARATARLRAGGSSAGERVVRAALSQVGAPEPGFGPPVARSFCGSPSEAWVRARLGSRLVSCEAREMRSTLRTVDRTLDRLDVQWREGEARNPASGVMRYASWFLTDDEVLELDDPRLARWSTDPPRHAQDAFRAAMLRLGSGEGFGGVARGRCVLALEEPPAGLARGWELAPTGLYRTGTRVTALVWAECEPDWRDPAVRDERARVFVLASVELRAGGGAVARERARLCLGVDRCATPP